jgi:hypothetical protein
MGNAVKPASVDRSWRESMDKFAELIQRLLEIQCDERRNPALIEEDARLLERLRKRAFGAKPAQTVKLSQDSRVGQRFKA